MLVISYHLRIFTLVIIKFRKKCSDRAAYPLSFGVKPVVEYNGF